MARSRPGNHNRGKQGSLGKCDEPRIDLLNRTLQPALSLFALGMVGLGILALTYGDFALVWQPVAPWIPGRTALAYISGGLMSLGGVALIFRSTGRWAAIVLFPYLIAWTLLKVPALVVAPKMEAVWLGFGELVMLLSGGWVLFARFSGVVSPLGFATGDRGVRIARVFFALALIPVGLSHIFYAKQTAELVPAWLPYRIGWAYLTGAGQMACGLGILFSVLPRIAAIAEAGMISLFGLLVWLPAVMAAPRDRLPGRPSSSLGQSLLAPGSWRRQSPHGTLRLLCDNTQPVTHSLSECPASASSTSDRPRPSCFSPWIRVILVNASPLPSLTTPSVTT
jgi:uncharacterized membrane protein